jgi:hypothetical protein
VKLVAGMGIPHQIARVCSEIQCEYVKEHEYRDQEKEDDDHVHLAAPFM